MTPTVITPPATLPLSLDIAKAHCRLDVDLEDNLIERLIWTAYQFAEHYQQRTLLATTYEMKLRAFPDMIALPLPPYQSMEFIKYIATNGDEITLDSSLYDVDLSTPQGVIYPAYGQSWPSVRCQRNAVTVRWTAGADTISRATQSAMLLLVGHLFEHREAVSELTLKDVPLTVTALLDLDAWGNYA
ncbi:hypothetical protein GC163_12550 [bacterium]|nr:hypothetical protein [bacterium]